VGPERGPLSLASITEELLERNVAAAVHKTENTAVGSVALSMLHPSICKKFPLTFSTSGGRSVAIVRSQTQATELYTIIYLYIHVYRQTVQKVLCY
jgi:hypothetical protein